MIWQNPWAWLSLLTLALPLLIHLLGRRRARVQPFPTLRFLGPSHPLAVRRARLSDIALLLVRVGVLAAAVVALAQPLLLTEARRAQGRSLVRAILVDTSASMQRPALSNPSALAMAREQATRLAAGATIGTVVETANPAAALAGASEWLALHSGRREIVIVSDFQAGTLDATDLQTVDSTIGLRFHRIPVVLSDTLTIPLATGPDFRSLARASTAGGMTRVEWTVAPGAAVRAGHVRVMAEDSAGAAAAWQAALRAGVPVAFDTTRRVAIVYPAQAQRERISQQLQPLDQPWMVDIVTHLSRDPVLREAAREVISGTATPTAADSALVVMRAPQGHAAVLAGRRAFGGSDELVLLPRDRAESLLSAALIAATLRATGAGVPVSEWEPGVIPDDRLASWEQPAAETLPTPSTGAGDASDGRWFWLLALLLLGVETWMRRQRANAPAAVTETEAHERVA